MTAVTIEELAPQGFELAASWLSRTDINKWLTGEWRNRVTDPKILAIVVRNRKNRLFLVRSGQEACGLVGLADIDVADRTAMAWYLLGEPRFLGLGITTNAVRQMICLAFREMNLASVYAWIMEDNMASRRVLQKSGFSENGRIRKSTSSGGVQVDRIYFDILPDELRDYTPAGNSLIRDNVPTFRPRL